MYLACCLATFTLIKVHLLACCERLLSSNLLMAGVMRVTQTPIRGFMPVYWKPR